MPNGITIEIAGEHDWERVRALRLAALKEAPDAFCSTYEKESPQPPEWWQERLRSNRTVTLLAVAGEDAGMSVVARESESDAWLYAVWVAPAHRGRGVGDTLMVAAVEEARHMGMIRLLLEVGETNLPAQALYSRHGFVKTGRLTTAPPPREYIVEVEFALELQPRQMP
jgi:ribosomal protein S18 acetylase RimI-like enzyme